MINGPAAPIATIDALSVSGSRATLAGWAFDPNSSAASIQVHVYVNNMGRAFVANRPRADVNAVMGVSGQHGFEESVPLSPGNNTICAYAIGLAGDNNALIECRNITYSGAAAQARQLSVEDLEPPQSAPLEPKAAGSPTTSATAPLSAQLLTSNEQASPSASESALEPAVTSGSTSRLDDLPSSSDGSESNGSASPSKTDSEPAAAAPTTVPESAPAAVIEADLDSLVVDGRTGKLPVGSQSQPNPRRPLS